MLDRVDAAGQAAVDGTDAGAMERWHRVLASTGRQLEAAWLRLEKAADREIDDCLRVGDEIARWRKPLWPVLLGGFVATGMAVWFGLLWGGYLPVPEWIAPVVETARRWW